MSSIISAQGVVFATAMAVSGTVIVLALRLQKSLPTPHQFPLPETPSSPPPILRSCISSVGKKSNNKKKKRVHFAEDVVESGGDGEKFRKEHKCLKSNTESKVETKKIRGMPANRVALYNGILRDRVAQRLAYSY